MSGDMEELQLAEDGDWVMDYFRRQREKRWRKFWRRPAP